MGDMPTGVTVELGLFAANTGATPTVVERLVIADFQEHNAGTPLWSGISADTTFDRGLDAPFVLERDDADTGRRWRGLEWSTISPIPDAEEFARRLATLQSVSVTLEWTYRRQKFPRVRQREIVSGTTTIGFDADDLRASAVGYWRTIHAYAHLASVAEGRGPVDAQFHDGRN
jgi:hypothetical protein